MIFPWVWWGGGGNFSWGFVTASIHNLTSKNTSVSTKIDLKKLFCLCLVT